MKHKDLIATLSHSQRLALTRDISEEGEACAHSSTVDALGRKGLAIRHDSVGNSTWFVLTNLGRQVRVEIQLGSA